MDLEKLGSLIDGGGPSLAGQMLDLWRCQETLERIRAIVDQVDSMSGYRPEYAVAAIYDIRQILERMEARA